MAANWYQLQLDKEWAATHGGMARPGAGLIMPSNTSTMKPGIGGDIFNATYRLDGGVSQAPAAAQPISTLSSLMAQPTMPARPTFSAPPGAPPAPPAPNPFTDALAKNINAPQPTAPKSTPFQPMGLPTAPTLQTIAPLTTTPQLTEAEKRLQDLISNPGALQDSASYKFRVGQGQQALERSLGAKGLLNSGNRLSELTQYGQNMGSQEYEAENQRRTGQVQTYLTALANQNQAGVAAGSANNAALNALYGTQVQGTSAANATGAQAKSAADTFANQQYQAQLDALAKQEGTLANLYSNADTANTQRYGIDTTAGTARANTLADLYKTDVGAAADLYRTNVSGASALLPYQQQPLAPKPWWMT